MNVAPLFALRLRTPRLELRLPTRPELEELRELARAGVHPPEEMPFAVAWTDEIYSEDWVVAFHEQQREAWRPDTWDLELGVWANGELAGVQEHALEAHARHGLAARVAAVEGEVAVLVVADDHVPGICLLYTSDAADE